MSILDNDKRILHELRRIVFILDWVFAVTDLDLLQVEGDQFMAIKGIDLGAATPNVFVVLFVPPNGVPPTSGPTVTCDDPAIVLGPVGTPAANQFTATGPASDTNKTCNITANIVNGAGVTVTHTFNVPLIAAAPVQITDLGLDQVS